MPAEDRAALEPQLERIDAEAKLVLFDVDQPIEYVYFPEGLVASIVGVLSDASAIETATVGLEGMVGLPVFLGTDRTTAQALVQVPGPGLRMTSDAFRAAVARSPALSRTLHLYTQALFMFIGQSSACNRMHSMRERCARWLLHTHDRVGQDEFPLTHEFLSQMLGVRRATVTEAMGALQKTGAIAYNMGRVRVRNRAKLEASACECYAIVTREFERLLGMPIRPPKMPNPLRRVTTSKRGRSTLTGAKSRRNPE